VIPASGAGYSGFWLADPHTGDVRKVLETGVEISLKRDGELVAVLDSNRFRLSEPISSTISLVSIVTGEKQVLLKDQGKYISLGDWSPDEQWFFCGGE
jgi:hypothetical protein